MFLIESRICNIIKADLQVKVLHKILHLLYYTKDISILEYLDTSQMCKHPNLSTSISISQRAPSYQVNGQFGTLVLQRIVKFSLLSPSRDIFNESVHSFNHYWPWFGTSCPGLSRGVISLVISFKWDCSKAILKTFQSTTKEEKNCHFWSFP